MLWYGFKTNIDYYQKTKLRHKYLLYKLNLTTKNLKITFYNHPNKHYIQLFIPLFNN